MGTAHEHGNGGRGSHGRHRRDCGGAAWTPSAGRPGDRPGRHARPDPWPAAGHGTIGGSLPAFPSPRVPPAGPPSARPRVASLPGSPEDDEPTEPHALRPLPPDPLWPEESAGLSKFDLGTVPASVTPPKTWRGAALFTVFASAGVLVTLVFVSSSLMTPATNPAHIDALPGIGSGLPFTASGPATTGGGHRLHGAPPGTADTTTRNVTTGAQRTSVVMADGDTRVVVVGEPVGAAETTRRTVVPTHETEPAATTSYPPPTVVTVSPPPRILPHEKQSPKQMVDDTQKYYEYAANDQRKAARYTDDSLREQGIEKRYPHARSIQVRRIKADPAHRTTTNAITVHKDDGSTVTKKRTLTFSPGDDPKIVSDRPAQS